MVVMQPEKLLDKQKAGKKRMRQFGKVDIPQEAFISALKWIIKSFWSLLWYRLTKLERGPLDPQSSALTN